MKKLTKREHYEEIKNLISLAIDNDFEGFDFNGMMDFCDKEIEAIDTKAAKAKERAAIKRAEGDVLRDAVQAVLSDEPMTVAEIIAALPESIEEVTPSKVVNRLSRLADESVGIVIKGKTSIPNEDGKGKRNLTTYRLA